jgi:ketosteroid isomerase-like protein
MGHPDPASLVRDLYDAFAKRDAPTLKRLIHEEAAWHVPGRNPLSGAHQGHDAIFAYFGRLGQLSGGTYRGDLVDVLGSGTRAAAYVASKGSREGRTLDETYLLLFEFRDGRVLSARLYPEDAHRFDAFWS